MHYVVIMHLSNYECCHRRVSLWSWGGGGLSDLHAHQTHTLACTSAASEHADLFHFASNSPQASSHNDSGDYESARKFGKVALCCNSLVFVYYILLILAGVVLVAVYFTVGFSALVATADAVADTTFTLPTLQPITVPNVNIQ